MTADTQLKAVTDERDMLRRELIALMNQIRELQIVIADLQQRILQLAR